MRLLLRLIFLVGVFCPCYLLAAESNDLPRVIPKPIQVGAVLDFGMPPGQAYALVFVGVVGIITLLVQAILLWRARAFASDAARLTLITLIATLAVGTVVMGYSDRQIAPVMALFGSIVGYLLGRNHTPDRTDSAGQKPNRVSDKDHP